MASLHLKPNQAFNEFEKLEFNPTSLQDEQQEGRKVPPPAKPTTQLSSKEIIDNYF